MLKPAAVLAALLLTACSGGPQPTVSSQPMEASVVTVASGPMPVGTSADLVRVLDGDSLMVRIDNNEVEVRLIGVNAPEGTECHGDVARDTLEAILASGEITLVTDPQEETDQFGRALRYLYVDRLNVNLALLANGDAIAIQSGHPAEDEFTRIADAAQSAGLGMWAPDACGPETQLPTLEIVDYRYNPSGRDEESMNEEWVAIANSGSTTGDLGGWVLRDESTQNRFVFPTEFTITPSSEVTVHSGCGDDTTTDLYWCADDPVWSNGGDTVILQTPDGAIVAVDRFSGDF